MMKSIRTCRAFDGYERKGSKMAIQGVATGAKCRADADNLFSQELREYLLDQAVG